MSKTKVYRASAPSNIAFLKYWGKRDGARQWAANNSISMTLNRSRTQTDAYIAPHKDHVVRMESTTLDRSHNAAKKIFGHLDYLADQFGFSSKLAIETNNTFPKGCGIASSASGLAALTIASLAAWTQSDSFEQLATKGFPLERLADLARLGSGSACRSLWGGFVRWDAGQEAEQQKIAPLFTEKHWSLHDVIVLISDKEKAVSSSEGHKYAWSSPLFKPRLSGLPEREKAIMAAIKTRDIHQLGPLLEVEALEMHSVMMSMEPPARYLTEESCALMDKVREWRTRANIPVYFTIDAGPNLHLICESGDVGSLLQELENMISSDRLIVDEIGAGPTLGLAF